jgi:hypothetical protein
MKAHIEEDEVRGAYNYAKYLSTRRKMMQWWAEYLDGLRDNVRGAAFVPPRITLDFDMVAPVPAEEESPPGGWVSENAA